MNLQDFVLSQVSCQEKILTQKEFEAVLEWFDENKDFLSGETKAGLEKLVNNEELRRLKNNV